MRYFQKKTIQAMEAWHPDYDMTNVSVSVEDSAADSPKIGDFIATNPSNPNDKWLVAEEFIKENYIEVNKKNSFYDRLLIEAQELATKTNALNDFMRTQSFIDLDRPNKDLLYKQSRLMNEYLQVLGQRLEILGKKFSFKG
jgi:hypothetical protein